MVTLTWGGLGRGGSSMVTEVGSLAGKWEAMMELWKDSDLSSTSASSASDSLSDSSLSDGFDCGTGWVKDCRLAISFWLASLSC